MATGKFTLTQDRLKEILDYCPETGVFTWREIHGPILTGTVAGTSRSSGRTIICVDKTQYPAHSLAWLYVYGELPKKRVLHRDKNPANNRIANLRDATVKEKRPPLTAERVRELFDYDPQTGEFSRKIKSAHSIELDTPVGRVSKRGRKIIKVDGAAHYAHRIAWLHFYGKQPGPILDHINGNPLDNRICNLREVDDSGNAHNQRKAHTGSRSGLIGAYYNNGKWRSTIQVNGVQIALGNFSTPEEAHEAYVQAKRKLHSTCTI